MRIAGRAATAVEDAEDATTVLGLVRGEAREDGAVVELGTQDDDEVAMANFLVGNGSRLLEERKMRGK